MFTKRQSRDEALAKVRRRRLEMPRAESAYLTTAAEAAWLKRAHGNRNRWWKNHDPETCYHCLALSDATEMGRRGR